MSGDDFVCTTHTLKGVETWKQQHTKTQQQPFESGEAFFAWILCGDDVQQAAVGCTRRERRHIQCPPSEGGTSPFALARHERVAVAMALAKCTHHSQQKTAQGGSLTQYFKLNIHEVPAVVGNPYVAAAGLPSVREHRWPLTWRELLQLKTTCCRAFWSRFRTSLCPMIVSCPRSQAKTPSCTHHSREGKTVDESAFALFWYSCAEEGRTVYGSAFVLFW